MHITPLTWTLTILLTVGVLAFDLVVIGRRPHEPSRREVVLALGVYVVLAIAFGAGVWLTSGASYGTQFFAGWLTEYSLSIDNLFVFLIVMGRFGVPARLQQSALMAGIVIALVMRGAFIAVGAALINEFSWVFYVFGLFLVYTALGLARGHGGHDDAAPTEARAVRWMRRVLPITETWHGPRWVAQEGGRRVVTPMLLVVVVLGTTDLLFALDSIPAIYGLTKQPYLVLTANIFALMGLRQLYFLIGDLLERLVYLSYGLAFLLAFIGVKLVLHALHENTLPFLNGGHHVGWAPDVPTWLSLAVIAMTLVVTTALSLLADHRSRESLAAPLEP